MYRQEHGVPGDIFLQRMISCIWNNARWGRELLIIDDSRHCTDFQYSHQEVISSQTE